MKLEEVIKLIDAGYTKADIDAFTASAADPQPAASAPAPSPEPAPAEAPAEAKADNTEVLTAIAELTKSINRMNLVNGSAKVPDKDDALNAALSKLIGGK